MQRSSEWEAFNEGTEVVAADGVEVGDVVVVHDTYIVVGERIASTIATVYYLPTSIIGRMDGARAWLSVTRDEALARAPFRGWPTSDGHEQGDRGDMQRSNTKRDTKLTEDDAPFEHQQDSARTHQQDDDSINVPVQEEELTATRREVDRGSVRVEKDVVEEEQSLDVPVTEERVTVNRRSVDREATSGDAAFGEGTIDVPVRGEEVDVQKRARVTEEVEIGKEAVGQTERVSDTVRREEVRVGETKDGTSGGGS